ncbi:MAG: guanylate kinase [Deltaproteobacteria bacterium]|nr:MAG: guanylate kinase [Deltaproteobacteria bacterium]
MRDWKELVEKPLPGLMLVLSAPSGAGKTTLARRLVEALPDAVFSVSFTTRPPRPGEQSGRDYHFVDEATFEGMVAEGAFLEWAVVHGSRYGTAWHAVRDDLEHGKVVVFDIDVQGGEQIARSHPDAVTVLVVPPSREELERRLRGRGTDAEETVRRRLAAAETEVARALATYRYLVVNDALDHAFEDLVAIVRAERLRLSRRWGEEVGARSS